MARRGEGIDRGTAGWPRGRGGCGCSAAVVAGTGRGCAGLEDALAPVGLAGSRPGGWRKERGRRREERRFRVGRRGGRLTRADWRGMVARGQTRDWLAARVGLGWVRVGVARLARSSCRGAGASSRLGARAVQGARRLGCCAGHAWAVSRRARLGARAGAGQGARSAAGGRARRGGAGLVAAMRGALGGSVGERAEERRRLREREKRGGRRKCREAAAASAGWEPGARALGFWGLGP